MGARASWLAMVLSMAMWSGCGWTEKTDNRTRDRGETDLKFSAWRHVYTSHRCDCLSLPLSPLPKRVFFARTTNKTTALIPTSPTRTNKTGHASTRTQRLGHHRLRWRTECLAHPLCETPSLLVGNKSEQHQQQTTLRGLVSRRRTCVLRCDPADPVAILGARV